MLGCLVFLSLVFFVLGARVLKTQIEYRSRYNQLEKTLAALQKQNEVLQRGAGPDNPGVLQLRGQLDHVTAGRGNVWYNVAPGEINPQSGVVNVTVGGETPKPLVADRSVYAFGDREAGHGYLGEFRVTAANDGQGTLTPVAQFTTQELQRLQNSPGPWTLYDVMPADSHEAFAELSDEQLDELLPAETVAEYRKDGKPADPNDPPDRVFNGKYERQLRDYVGEFHEYARLRSVYLDRVASAQKDQEYLTGQIQKAEQTVAFRGQQIETTKQEIAQLTRENQAVANHRQQLESQLADVRASIQRLAEENNRLADRLAQWQFSSLGRGNPSAQAGNR
jgi:hypothetical protein